MCCRILCIIISALGDYLYKLLDGLIGGLFQRSHIGGKIIGRALGGEFGNEVEDASGFAVQRLTQVGTDGVPNQLQHTAVVGCVGGLLAQQLFIEGVVDLVAVVGQKLDGLGNHCGVCHIGGHYGEAAPLQVTVAYILLRFVEHGVGKHAEGEILVVTEVGECVGGGELYQGAAGLQLDGGNRAVDGPEPSVGGDGQLLDLFHQGVGFFFVEVVVDGDHIFALVVHFDEGDVGGLCQAAEGLPLASHDAVGVIGGLAVTCGVDGDLFGQRDHLVKGPLVVVYQLIDGGAQIILILRHHGFVIGENGGIEDIKLILTEVHLAADRDLFHNALIPIVGIQVELLNGGEILQVVACDQAGETDIDVSNHHLQRIVLVLDGGLIFLGIGGEVAGVNFSEHLYADVLMYIVVAGVEGFGHGVALTFLCPIPFELVGVAHDGHDELGAVVLFFDVGGVFPAGGFFGFGFGGGVAFVGFLVLVVLCAGGFFFGIVTGGEASDTHEERKEKREEFNACFHDGGSFLICKYIHCYQ